MSYEYIESAREDDDHALPDVEVFKAYDHECWNCGAHEPLSLDYYGLLYPAETECAECGKRGFRCLDTVVKWYFWFCFPGCLPDSEASGPYASEEEALAAAREMAGFCPHGVPADDSDDPLNIDPSCAQCAADARKRSRS